MNKLFQRTVIVSALGALGVATACLVPGTAHADETSFIIEAKRVGLLAQDAEFNPTGDPSTSEYNAMQVAWFVCANLEGGRSEALVRSALNEHHPPEVSRQWMEVSIQEVCPQFL
ncbi:MULTISPECIES: DUF732 domain-containing protein [Nocardia]|uniref:DUF732 domain-containing protein n=1 Tax=Nocardia TaxID=1817 RepID=UPI002457E1CB|nr:MULTISPECIES: DUF732 domain-containing protein [Nocardia]